MTKKLKLSVIFIITLLVLSFLTGLSFLIYNIAKDTQSASYTLTTDTNGGGLNQTYTGNSGSTINLPRPAREGYRFMGWIPKNYVSGAKIGNLGVQLGNKVAEQDSFFTSNIKVSTYGSVNTLTRVSASYEVANSPSSSYMMEISNTGTTNPGLGGFTFHANTYADCLYITIIQAKIPLGHAIGFATNQMGGSGTYEWVAKESGWLTPVAGTGYFETYIHYAKAWPSSAGGFYSTTGFFWINGTAGTSANPLKWYVSSACIYDATSISFNKNTFVDNLLNATTYTFGSGNQTLVACWEAVSWADEVDTDWQGSGTENDPYLISSAQELAGIASQTAILKIDAFKDVYFKQTADINLECRTWLPIGVEDAGFCGHYDGNGKIINGLYMFTCDIYSGLFGFAYKANIKNITLKNSYIETTKRFCGSIVGYTYGGEVSNCVSYGDVTYIGESVYDNTPIGGVVGRALFGTVISDCKNYGNIFSQSNYDTCYDTGGILGYGDNATILRCYNSGNIEGTTSVGGIAGQLKNGTISHCQNVGRVYTRWWNAGGIVGRATNATISYCINDSNCLGGYTMGLIVGKAGESPVTISYCEAKGLITSHGSGGILGEISGTTASIENCCVYAYASGYPLDGVFVTDWCSDLTTIKNCVGVLNNEKIYTGSDFSAFAILKNMNNGLPMLRGLYSIADVAPEQSTADFISYLDNLGFINQRN